MHSPPLVLIADDEADSRILLETICYRAGLQVISVSNGQTALNSTIQHEPDLVLLDVQMPIMTGFDVVEALRSSEKTRLIPIIIITAAATTPSDIEHGFELGADDYIPKPFSYHELTARIRSKLRARELEERIHQRTHELERLVRLGIEMTHPPRLEPMGNKLLYFLTEDLGATTALLYVTAAPDHPGVALIRRNGNTEKIGDLGAIESYIRAMPGEEAHFLNGEQANLFFPNESIQSTIVAPLTSHEVFSGLLVIGHPQNNHFDNHILQVMSIISQQTAMSVLNIQLFESLQAYNEALESRVEERTAALRSAQEILMRSEKLAALGRLSAEIAHEVNNPLQPIITCLENAIEDIDSNLPVDPEDLRLALSEAARLKRMVTRLLDFARPDTGGIVPTDLLKLIQEVLALIHKKLERTHIQVIENLQPVPTIQANPDQLRQVFLNLTINAIDAMMQNEKGVLEVILYADKQFIHISVRDNGTGIPAEQINRIFDPFFSTKESGSGLGLTVTHTIIAAQGGNIDVKSHIGKGTEFIIRLPIR